MRSELEQENLLTVPQSPVSEKSLRQYLSNSLSCFPTCSREQLIAVSVIALAITLIAVTVLSKAGVFGHRNCDAQAHCGGQPAVAP